MAQQLFWFETLLKFISGVLLLVAPVSLARLMGLPHGQVGFWARILGLTLIGLAGAIYIEASQPSSRGLGFAGLAVINVSAIIAFFALIMTGQVKTWRGTIALWSTIGVLLLLTLFEIAYA
jgi:hypothetical protein